MLNKKLPFKEENDVFKTLNNIMKGKYLIDSTVDDEMNDMMERMLKVNNEDRMSLIELHKEMIKVIEIIKDSENNIMITEERKKMLFNNDYRNVKLPIIIPSSYYLENERWEEIREDLIKCYNNKADERVLSILLMMKLYKKDKSIENKLKFQIPHKNLEDNKCYLDKMVFNTCLYKANNQTLQISSDDICYCEKGLNYFFTMMKLTNPKQLWFGIILIILFL